jgi:beta-xylosidase
MNKICFVLLTGALLSAVALNGQMKISENVIKGSWGDQGNGTYINPVLNADYSDPDVIRVGNKYYMVCSEFHFMGMPVLESHDMVNWKIISRVYDHLDFPEYNSNDRYAGGSWAPAIRYHDNRFWIYFCTPDEGLFMSSAEKAEGPWDPLVLVKAIARWEDPCPFWDEDGRAYLGHSLKGAGPIIIHKLSTDGKQLLDDGVTVYTGPTAEGTKIFKLNKWYYLSIPEGGVAQGWQTILRSKNIYGPYEKKIVLEKGVTSINGPHQGSLVDTPEGQWWFYHFQSDGAMGRVVHLQPVIWQEEWPVIGVDIDRNGIGEPVYLWRKPDINGDFNITAPQSDDDFNSSVLGLQWQWNHNPVNDSWSLTEKPGFLVLKAMKADNFVKARNTLTQKVMGTTGVAIAEMDISSVSEGQKAGLCSMGGKVTNLLGIMKKEGVYYIFTESDGKIMNEKIIRSKTIFFKVQMNIKDNKSCFLYSTDNKSFTAIGEYFPVASGYWKGTRIGLFCYNVTGNEGSVAFNWFTYNYDGPKGQIF